MRLTAPWIVLIGSLFLAACGDGISGTYADEDNVTRYTFAGDGAVEISVLGARVSAEYRRDGDKILVSSAQGTVVLTFKDGHLYGPMGLRLKRQND